MTVDAIHLVSPDSRADVPLPCFMRSAGKRVPRPAMRGGWPVNPRGSTGGGEHAKTGLAASQADERARLSTRSRGLLGRSDDVCRREEPPRDESGLRAHGSNQRFHRLLRHAVARALTTAPSLAGVSPAADDILTLHGWRRKGRQGRCRVNDSNSHCSGDGGRGRAEIGHSEVAVPFGRPNLAVRTYVIPPTN